MKSILIFLTIALGSCHAPKHIHSSGTYIVLQASQPLDGYQIISFKNYAGQYKLMADTIKPGDSIRMNVVRIKRR